MDPYFSAEADEAAGKFHTHFGNPNLWFHEEVRSGPSPKDPKIGRCVDTTYSSCKIRVAVEATPEEIADMEKMEKTEKK